MALYRRNRCSFGSINFFSRVSTVSGASSANGAGGAGSIDAKSLFKNQSLAMTTFRMRK